MTLFGTITIPVSPWLWRAAALILAALLLLVWSYRGAPRRRGMHGLAFGLKLLGLSALALCLVEPLWMGRRARPGANVFAVLADNSSGMNVRDRGMAQTRGEILQSALETGRAGWLAALAETFEVRHYLFDSRLRRAPGFSDLTFDGKATSLAAALRTVTERYEGRPLAGILLMTDGCATDMGEPFPDLSGLPPIYPVVVGQDRPPKDISLANVTVSQTSFEDAPVTIQADIETAGFAGRAVAVDLLDDAGKLVEHREWAVRDNDDKQVFRFRLRPEKTGVLFHRVRVVETSEGTPGTESEASVEATLANNERTVVVDRGRGPYRILYVAGRPNWDFKFLKRAVDEDEQVQLVALLRVARREPKYDWRGRAGETSNPLYRGFDTQNQDEAEQYDQPVLVRLNTRDKVELQEGFPKTSEELFDYHAVILDDVEAEFFSHDQMDLLRRFVTERGGGFLMLGGQESFQRGNFQRTPIGGILPVYLDPAPGDAVAARMRMHLTREGWLQPWIRLRDNEKDEQQRLAEMPEFHVINRARVVKPGARVVATVGDGEAQPLPALVVQRLGNGRTAALAVGDIWRWGLRNPEMHGDMDKFWRQTLRWLIADVPGRIALQAHHKPDEINQPVVLRVRVRDKAFEPMDNVSVSVEVQEPGDQKVQLATAHVPAESGLFEATYVPRNSGGYLARATVTDPAGTRLGEAETGWTADLEAREFQSIRTNRPLLEKIARQTGGRLVEVDDLDDFARSLPHREVPITDVWVRPLWDLRGIPPALFLFVLTCLVAEWALRRWKGMP